MEFLSLIISLLISLPFLFIFLKTKEISKQGQRLSHIPGPKKLPLIGNLNLMRRDTLHHHLFRDLAAKYGPLMHVQLGELQIVLVSSLEYVKELMTMHDVNISNRPHNMVTDVVLYHNSDIGFSPYGDYWRLGKKMLSVELLSGRRVRSYQPMRDEENRKMVKWLASHEGTPINLSEKIHALVYVLTTKILIGSETPDEEKILSIFHYVAKVALGMSIGDLYPSVKWLDWVFGDRLKLQKVRHQLDEILDKVIQQHKQSKNDQKIKDLTDILLEFQEINEVTVTDDNIKGILMGVYLAGSDTSPIVVEWALAYMMRDPEKLKKAQDEVRKTFDVGDKAGYVVEEKLHELEYMKLVIKEALRLHPPTPLLAPRLTIEKFQLDGYEIPPETTLMINAWALGRDPKYWGNDAEEFRPERFIEKAVDYKGNHHEFLPFGAGRRMCPGITLGVVIIEIMLATLLYHFDWALPPGTTTHDLDMSEVVGTTAGKKHPLRLIPTLVRPLKD